jgi:hypothetical protein
MPGRSPLKTARRRPLLTTLALALLATLAVTATAATANDSVQINFDPHKCAASYAAETKRAKVPFTAFAHQKSGHFKVTVNLPIHLPSGDKPGHYACSYLVEIIDNGTNIKPVASASAKY